MNTSTLAPASPAPLLSGTPAPAGFVRAPHPLITDPAVSDAALQLWLTLASISSDWVEMSQARLAERCGWISPSCSVASAERRVRNALTNLQTTGWLAVRHQVINRRTIPSYRIIDRAPRALFERVTRAMLQYLARYDGAPMLLRHWLAWRKTAGAKGWADVCVEDFAQTHHFKPDTVYRRRQELVAAGLVILNSPAGRAATVRFPDYLDPTTTSQAPTPCDVRPAAGEEPAELSGTTPPNCPPGSRRLSDNDLDTDSGPAPAKAVDEAVAELPASPESERKSTDRYAQAAREIVAAAPELAELPDRVRGMLRQLIAKQLRTTPDRDLSVTRQQILDELEVLDQLGQLTTNHAGVIRDVLRRWHADRKAAPDNHTITTLIEPAPAQPAPSGPTLAELAQRPMPTDAQMHQDPTRVVDALAIRLAQQLVVKVTANPGLDVDEFLERAAATYRRQLPPSAWIATQFAPQIVRNAHLAAGSW